MRALKTLLVMSLSAAGVMAFAATADATTRIQKTFGNWKVDCTEAETGKKACALQYALVTKKDQRLVFRLKRQQFIELLRQQTAEADGAALGEHQAQHTPEC